MIRCTQNRFINILFTFVAGILLTGENSQCQNPTGSVATESLKVDYYAIHADTAPVIDGRAHDAAWEKAEWKLIDQLWLGTPASQADFSGRYKITWNSDKLYILAEITDDRLSDLHADPLDHYWDDDCLELFIDEDHSGGVHQYNHNAFAYHIALDARVVDLGTNTRPQEYTSHMTVKRSADGTKSLWEIGLDVFTDTYVDGSDNNHKAELKIGKKIGYAVAYCDADGEGYRESFYGSTFIAGQDKNRAYINSSLFGTLLLIE